MPLAGDPYRSGTVLEIAPLEENVAPGTKEFPDRPRRNPENAFRAVGDKGGLVVQPERSSVKVLNPVGSKIYSLLDGAHTQDEIVRAVIDEFDVDEAQARGDLQRYLEELDADGLLAPPASEAAPTEERVG
jgi:hypothetical protein